MSNFIFGKQLNTKNAQIKKDRVLKIIRWTAIQHFLDFLTGLLSSGHFLSTLGFLYVNIQNCCSNLLCRHLIHNVYTYNKSIILTQREAEEQKQTSWVFLYKSVHL